MCIFKLFKKRKYVLSKEDQKWNKMWSLWTEGQVKSPYAELMTYQSMYTESNRDAVLLNKKRLSPFGDSRRF